MHLLDPQRPTVGGIPRYLGPQGPSVACVMPDLRLVDRDHFHLTWWLPRGEVYTFGQNSITVEPKNLLSTLLAFAEDPERFLQDTFSYQFISPVKAPAAKALTLADLMKGLKS